MSCVLEARLRSHATIANAELEYAGRRLASDPANIKRRLTVARAKETKANIVVLQELHMTECEMCFNSSQVSA